MRRLLVLFGLTAILAAATAAPAGAAAPEGSRILGIVPVHEQGKPARPGGGGTSNLSYHGGPVMVQNRTYAIFWAGSNYGTGWETGYRELIRRYFGDVAAASGTTANVYDSDTQYYDTISGSQRDIQYSSTFGGYYDDTTPYPASLCTDKATSVCLRDDQLQTEIQAVMSAQGWSAVGADGVQNVFFIFTPKGVGSCAGSSCAYTQFCAYHSWIGSGGSAILYANQPYANQNYRIYTCNSGQWPNGNSADATLNVVSHEHNEAITDEQGSAWFDSQGYENGDKCAWNFGTALGGASGSQWNQVINGNHYYLQQEWSNAHPGCLLTGT